MSVPSLLNLDELESVESLCAAGVIPLTRDWAKRHCRKTTAKTYVAPQLAAIKIAGQWMTTREAVRLWKLKGANQSMRRLAA